MLIYKTLTFNIITYQFNVNILYFINFMLLYYFVVLRELMVVLWIVYFEMK